MIHIVDDEEPLRDALAWLLKSHALPCRAFESAEAFLEYLHAPAAARNDPGCVLLDIRMPGLGGEGLFAKLRDEALCPAWSTRNTRWPATARLRLGTSGRSLLQLTL